MRPFFIFCLLLFQFPQAIAFNESEKQAKKLLRAMADTVKNRNYEGLLLINNHDSDLMVVKLLHKAADHVSKEQEKLTTLDGEPQEVVIDGNGMLLYVPNNKNLTVIRNPFVDTFANISSSKSYKLNFLGVERISGKRANVIAIAPKDELRYRYKLWLDASSNMYLRAQWFDNNKIIYESALLNLKFLDGMPAFASKKVNKKMTTADAAIPPGRDVKGEFEMMDANGVDAGHGWCQVNWLPDGFKLLNRSVFPPEGPGQTGHLVYSDGIAKISIYLDFASDAKPENFQLGRTNIYSIPLSEQKRVVILGEVPFATIKKIAESVEIE